MIQNFDSIFDYFRFSTAREFYTNEEQAPYAYRKNFVEKSGDILMKPLVKSADGTLKHFKDPPVIISVTLSMMGVVTYLLYPDLVSEKISYLLPAVTMIQPWMLKSGVFSLAVSTLFGWGARTFGRLENPELMEQWRQRRIVPIQLGTFDVRNGG